MKREIKMNRDTSEKREEGTREERDFLDCPPASELPSVRCCLAALELIRTKSEMSVGPRSN